MPPTGNQIDWALVDVAVPRPADRLPGVSMAGFRQRVRALVDIEMIVHPSVTLFFDLSDGGCVVHDAEGGQRRGSFVAGLLPGQLRAGGWSGECLQIRLSPVVAAAVLRGPADLAGTVTDLADVWGRDLGQVEERLRATTSWDERFAIAAEELGRRLNDRPRPPVDPEVAHTWRRTLAGRGRVRVDGLAETVGWSRKRLWSRFRAQLGLTPKRAAQLVRFDYAAHRLAAGQPAARVAAESGYADQSHLHREIRSIAGLTPSAVAAAPWLAIDDVAWPGRQPGP